MSKHILALWLAVALLLSGCAGTPVETPAPSDGTPSVTHEGSVPAATEGSAPAATQEPVQPATEEAATEEAVTEPAEPVSPTEEGSSAVPAKQLSIRFASKEEGTELLMANVEYHAGFSQNDIEFRLQTVGADMEEYLAFAREQVRDFTEEEKELLLGFFDAMEQTLTENGYTLPPMDEILFIKTTMAEEAGAGGYTHGTQIYLADFILESAATENEYQWWYKDYLYSVCWHELFHCLTRMHKDFQREMYALIHFTLQEEDFPIPPSVQEYHISNPDVEHHNSYATFLVNGEEVRCFTDLVTTKHFDTPGECFFDCCTTALIPVSGEDVYYTPEQTENFDAVFGTNTGYVIDPEECMADNFALALRFGMQGADGTGYPNPEIIEGILAYLTR